MDLIYSNSYLIICAADGIDSNTRLLGIPNSSHPRNQKEPVLDFSRRSKSSRFVKVESTE